MCTRGACKYGPKRFGCAQSLLSYDRNILGNSVDRGVGVGAGVDASSSRNGRCGPLAGMLCMALHATVLLLHLRPRFLHSSSNLLD